MSLFQFINSQHKTQTLFCRDKFSTSSYPAAFEQAQTECANRLWNYYPRVWFIYLFILEKEEKYFTLDLQSI